MKNAWQRIAARVDEMNLRQRAMLFAVLSLVVVVLAHVILLEPVLVRQKRLIDQGNRDQSQIAAIRGQIQSVLRAQQGDPQDPELAALQRLEERVAQVERTLAQSKQAFVAPTRLPTLLKDLLGPSRPVILESLRVMPGVPVKDGTELFRHGVEMSVRGSYFELLQYLADLEKLPGRLLWGPVELQAETYPEVRLTLQVHTLSTQRSLGL